MRFLSLLFLGSILSASILARGETNCVASDDNSVTVQAAAIAKAPPDKLELFLEVRTTRPTVKESSVAVKTSVERLLAALKAAGIPDAALRVNDVEQSRDYEWAERKRIFRGYTAATGVRLTLTDFTKLTRVQTEILADELIEVKGMRRSCDREGELRRRALADAAEAARLKAQVLATALGAKLGPVVRISETPYENQSAGWTLMANSVQATSSEADESSSSVQEVSVRASLTVKFALAR